MGAPALPGGAGPLLLSGGRTEDTRTASGASCWLGICHQGASSSSPMSECPPGPSPPSPGLALSPGPVDHWLHPALSHQPSGHRVGVVPRVVTRWGGARAGSRVQGSGWARPGRAQARAAGPQGAVPRSRAQINPNCGSGCRPGTRPAFQGAGSMLRSLEPGRSVARSGGWRGGSPCPHHCLPAPQGCCRCSQLKRGPAGAEVCGAQGPSGPVDPRPLLHRTPVLSPSAPQPPCPLWDPGLSPRSCWGSPLHAPGAWIPAEAQARARQGTHQRC